MRGQVRQTGQCKLTIIEYFVPLVQVVDYLLPLILDESRLTGRSSDDDSPEMGERTRVREREK